MPAAVNGGVQSGAQVLELDGVSVGSVQSFTGGDARGDVVIEVVGLDGIAHKHLGGVVYEDISITCGAGMATSFYDWLQQTLDRNFSRKNGAIVTYDFSGNEISRLSFSNALLTEVRFPLLDASSTDLATISIKITPQRTTRSAGKSTMILSAPPSKRWLISNFRLQVDGLDFSGASRIEAITVSQSVVSNSVGETRDYQVEPAYLVVPDLTVTVADDQKNAALYQWYESFVIGGNDSQGQEKSGTLEYLSSDLKTTLFTLSLKQLGIFRMTPLTGAASQSIRRIQTAMYCEQMLLSYGSTSATVVPASTIFSGATGAGAAAGAGAAQGAGLAARAGAGGGAAAAQSGAAAASPQPSGSAPNDQTGVPSRQAPRTVPLLRFRT